MIALGTEDHDRADRLIGRVARMPYDDHEGAAPGAVAAHMTLFALVTDALEVSEPDDSRWLDAAIDVMEHADEPARFDMRDVLTAIAQDYELGSAEGDRIQRAVAPVPDRSETRDLRLDDEELARHIRSILEACREYRSALTSR